MRLAAECLTVGYVTGHRVTDVITGINAELHEGALTVIVGANGSGKSTLLRTLGGVQPAIAGRVTIGGLDVSRLDVKARSRLVAVVFTDRVHGGGLTVEETVAIGRQPYTGFFGRLGTNDRSAVAHALEAVGMSDKRRRFVATLSDGERQKVMFAKALAQDTPIIILDEPTSFLDVSARFEAMSLLRRLTDELDKTVLLSTHDIGPAITVAEDIWAVTSHQPRTLVCGSKDDIVAGGVMDEVFGSPEIVFDRRSGNYRYVAIPD